MWYGSGINMRLYLPTMKVSVTRTVNPAAQGNKRTHDFHAKSRSSNPMGRPKIVNQNTTDDHSRGTMFWYSIENPSIGAIKA